MFEEGVIYMDGRRRRRMIRKSRKARKNALLVLTMTLVVGLGTIAMGAQGGKAGEVCYESVLIHPGDTLWTIAEGQRPNIWLRIFCS